jgi:hypothetical protein
MELYLYSTLYAFVALIGTALPLIQNFEELNRIKGRDSD